MSAHPLKLLPDRSNWCLPERESTCSPKSGYPAAPAATAPFVARFIWFLAKTYLTLTLFAARDLSVLLQEFLRSALKDPSISPKLFDRNRQQTLKALLDPRCPRTQPRNPGGEPRPARWPDGWRLTNLLEGLDACGSPVRGLPQHHGTQEFGRFADTFAGVHNDILVLDIQRAVITNRLQRVNEIGPKSSAARMRGSSSPTR